MTTAISVLTSLATANNLTSDSFARSLSAVKVRNAKPGADTDMLADGGGLLLAISPAGSRVWRYRFRLAGKQQTLTIGSYPEISLETARVAHRAARWLVERGEAPLTFVEREISRIEAEQAALAMGTFNKVADEWIKVTDTALAPRTRKHRKAMVDKYIVPKLDGKPIDTVTRKELAALLSELDAEKPETAKHVRGYLKQIFEFAMDRELVQGSPIPPAKILVKNNSRRVTPRKALPLHRMGEFIRAINDAPDSDPLTKLAFKLLILSWSRTSEIVGARWSEFDLQRGIWVVPAERMKGGEPHTVYLSRQALAVMDELKRHSEGREFVFTNRRRPDDHMSRMTLTNWRRRWGFQDEMDVHGLRAVASTWANESGRYRPDVIETALAHKELDRIRASYNRAKFANELRQLWQDWADLCDLKEAAARAENVVSADFGKVA